MKKVYFLRSLLVTALALLISGIAGLSAGASSLPSWWKDENSYVRTNNTLGPRVVDNADIFTDLEEARMLEAIGKVQELGIDLVIFTDNSSYGYDRGTYAEAFHYFNGYGFGEDFTGTVLFICMEPGNRGWWTAASGEVMDFYTYDVINALDDRLYPYMSGGDYGGGVLSYIGDVYDLYEAGGIPSEWGYKSYTGDPGYYPVESSRDISKILLFGAGAGVLVGLISVSSKKRAMKTVRTAGNASDYLVPGSFVLWKNRDVYLYSHVTRVKRETENRSGGGHSSYSGGHSSFGGSHYSGGGRSF